jgi:hypothetical protein
MASSVAMRAGLVVFIQVVEAIMRFAKPLLITLAWRFVSPRDGGATPPIQ